MPKYDAIVIGTGQAGPALAHKLAGAGQKVAIVERNRFGGTCVNTGCTPTKTLVASAYAAHLARRAGEFGVEIVGTIGVDMKKVKARKDYVLSFSTRGVERSLRNNPGITVYTGHARFASGHEVVVDSEKLEASQTFINVGGRALVPDIPGLEAVSYFTNSSILDVDFLPQHLLVIGGSYIGLEFAQIFRRFGSQVTVVELAPRLIPREDEDVSASVAEILAGEGVSLRLGVSVARVEKRAGEVVLHLSSKDGQSGEASGSHILMAVGRRPNTDDLGVEAAGIAVDQRGFIAVDDQLRTSAPGIWALGDCNGKGAFTHTAWNDFEIVAANLLEGGNRRVSDRIGAYNLYTDPPLGRVGMTETEDRKSVV